ncbi:MAG: hypothetical protein NTU53_17165 [Planctomycetota bacterium]|nr:hypothetical protein [Planctomycetota bacterium]
MMRAETPGQFATALRWLHVPAWALLVSLVGFVQLYLRAGRPWLAWSFFGLRTLSLLLDFLVGKNLNYREVTRLWHIPFFGESVSVAEGVSNPWMLVGQLSLLLLVIFVADATVTVWRRGERRQALAVGGSIVFLVLAATVQAVLVLWEIVHWPITVSLFFMAVVVAIGLEMSRDVTRTAQLSEDLQESEERMTLAAEAAGFGVWSWTSRVTRCGARRSSSACLVSQPMRPSHLKTSSNESIGTTARWWSTRCSARWSAGAITGGDRPFAQHHRPRNLWRVDHDDLDHHASGPDPAGPGIRHRRQREALARAEATELAFRISVARASHSCTWRSWPDARAAHAEISSESPVGSRIRTGRCPHLLATPGLGRGHDPVTGRHDTRRCRRRQARQILPVP